ncbi:MAG: tyrosine-type recombinase/integrase [Alphaproteobacteria bacterium]
MTRLPGVPGSTKFMDRLRELDAVKPFDAVSGTVGDLVKRYCNSPEFTQLTPGTKRQYNVRFGRLQPYSKISTQAITSKIVYDIRDKLNEKHSRSAANNTVAMLRILFDWAIKRNIVDGPNPAEKVDTIRRPKNAPVVNRPWRDEEIEIVMAEAPDWLKVAIAIAVYTGLRESDVANVTWASYDGTAFETRTMKTGAPVWIPAHPKLRAILNRAPRSSLNIVVGVRGRSMRGELLGSRFFQFMRVMRDTGRLPAGLTFHGFRHTLGTRLAEAGCDNSTIALVLGHSTPRMTERYTKTADRKRLAKAAFERLEAEQDGHENGKPKPGKPENRKLIC